MLSKEIHAEGTRLLRQVYSYPKWWCGTHTLEEDHTHTLHSVPWVGRVWASYRVKSVSLSSTWLADILYVSCFSLFKAIELNKVYTVTEDPTRNPGIGPSTIQPQHTYTNVISLLYCGQKIILIQITITYISLIFLLDVEFFFKVNKSRLM